ncbi:MAG: hypothetical protein WAK84_00850 [Candidatus Cybelea sp.]
MSFRHSIHCIAVALLGGCSTAQLPATAPTTVMHSGIATKHRSWMAAGAKKLDLLYVSDYETNDVYAYSYPQGKLRGVLAGILENFVLPTGLCSDGTGNVFVPDSANSTVLEYAHGSTKLAKTLIDANELPYSCAVDGTTGNLVVVNLESASGAGGVSIYSRARGLPQIYHYGFLYKWDFAAYDDKGNLFVDASYDLPSEALALVEMRKGEKTFETITLDQTFGAAGGVAWDGTHLAVGDAKSSKIYRFVIAGNYGTEVGTTQLRRARGVAQFSIDEKSILAADFHDRSVAFWKYPAGGMPVKSLEGFGEPFGVTLSKAALDRRVQTHM